MARGDIGLERDAAAPPEGRRSVRIREFLFGLTGYEFVREALELRAALEDIFMMVTVGDMIGLPVLPPYYALRLLPYVVPQTETWRRRVLRERELSEGHTFELHGV